MTKETNTLNCLMAPFPKDAVDRSRGAQTGRGYDTTGYGYQWVANRLNDVFGIAGWSAHEEILSVVEGATQKGRAWFEIVARVRIDFTDPETKAAGTRCCFGWHRASYLGDAYKGAFTNALKKTAALVGVGWQAYADQIDDDHQPIPEPEARGERRPTAQQIQAEARESATVKSEPKDQWPEARERWIKALGKQLFADCVGCDVEQIYDYVPPTDPTKRAAVKKTLEMARADLDAMGGQAA